VGQLTKAYGPALRAVVLYGSTVDAPEASRAPQAGARHDLLVIVDRLGMGELRAVAATARAWAEAGHPPPLTLTTEEWMGSADVFPMEYADVLSRHRVLHGALPIEGIRVEPADLRRELEHQVLGKLLQLRTAILGAGGDGGRQTKLLEASLGTMLVLFRSLARLHGASPPHDREGLARWAGATAGFDAAPFVRVTQHVRGAPLAAGEPERVLAGYLEGLGRLVRHVNTHDPARGPSA
jgi:hypothetical protein